MKGAIAAILALAVTSTSALEVSLLSTGVAANVFANPTHYGDPAGGCMSDEQSVQVQGLSGDFCSPPCTGTFKTTCPTDVPNGVTATPQCALQDGSSGAKYCALICQPGVDDGACGSGSCQSISGVGLCTYDSTDESTEFTDIVKEVNSKATTWTAEEPSRFGTMAEAKNLCGTWTKDHPKYKELELPESTTPVADSIPSDFDARTNWPKCTVISRVRDQSSCGSCWAFGSTEAFEDRRCVATGEDVVFSTMDTAGCCKGFACGFSMGCNGGQPSAALDWMSKTGVVTGKDFYDVGDGESCLPYSLQPCAHHVPASSKYPACPQQEYSVKCTKSCSEAKYSKSYADDKTSGTGAFSVNSVAQMQTEIMTNGPLAVAFSVYSDFPTYKTGVYKHTTGQMLGGHAVEMVGWGVEDGEDYWWIKNSWNEQWGDEGYFKIARGTNECGIEGDVTGVKF